MIRMDRRALIAGLACLPALGARAEDKGYVTGDLVLGAEDAPVTIYEYASLTCPHCARFHAVTLPEVKAQYIETGKVRFIMREVYFDQFGLWAAMTARCGDGSKYQWMLDKFLSEQAAWTRADDIAGAIRNIGLRSGLSSEALNACLTDAEYAKALLADYQANRAEHQIESTPTFIINGEKHTGFKDFAEFSKLIEPHLQG